MKPKLILLNGSLGSGKSTLAKKYAEDHPLTLCLDIDDVWSMLSNWREQKEISAPLSKSIAIEMARVNLNAGHDVVIPQIIQTTELYDRFSMLAQECGADYYPMLLYLTKDEAIRRFIERGKKDGHADGFRPGGIIANGGREHKLAEMYDAMMETAHNRPDQLRVEPVYEDIDGTYAELLQKIT